MEEYNECKYWNKCDKSKTYLCTHYPEQCLYYKELENKVQDCCKEVINK